jgi:hypothetical protein
MNIFLKSSDCYLNIFRNTNIVVILLCCFGFVTHAQESVSSEAYAFQDGKYTIQTNAPKHIGVYYKVQIISVGTFDKNDPDLQTAVKLGQLSTEYIVEKDVYRLLIGEYLKLSDAEVLLQKLKSAGFRDAFIVKYKHGIRVKM